MREKKTTRLLALIGVAAVASAAGLAGTGASASPTAALPSSITVWTYYNTAGQLAFEKEAASLFNAKFPSVKVNYLNVPFNSLDPKLLAAASVHSGPDAIVDNPVVDFPELSGAGALASMSPYMSQLGPTSPFSQSVLWRSGGKIETIQSYVNVVAFWYNKSILDKLHLSVPTNEAQLATDLAAVSKAGYTGLLLAGDPGIEGAWQLFPWLSNRGVTYCSLRSQTAVPTVTAALTQLRTWESNGWIPKDFDTFTQTSMVSTFLAGKTAFMENGNWNITDIEKGAKFSVGVVPMPAATQPAHVLLGGEGEAVGGYSSNKQIAWDYLRYGWLSAEAGKALLTDIGSLATRSDLGRYVSTLPYEGAFVKEVANGLGTWPVNKQVSKVTTDFGNVWSGFAGGSGTPQNTAQSIKSTVTGDLSSGGGTC